MLTIIQGVSNIWAVFTLEFYIQPYTDIVTLNYRLLYDPTGTDTAG